MEFEIVGIFSGKKQRILSLSSDFSENQVFTDYEEVINHFLGNSEASAVLL